MSAYLFAFNTWISGDDYTAKVMGEKGKSEVIVIVVWGHEKCTQHTVNTTHTLHVGRNGCNICE